MANSIYEKGKSTMKSRTQKNGQKANAKSPNSHVQDRFQATLERAEQFAAAGHYSKLLNLLDSDSRDPRIRNARGVGLLRTGSIEEAMRLFRELVMQPGCTWLRPEIPTIYKTNYATSLLMGGHPGGCLDILAEIHDENLDSVKRLRAAITNWRSSLTFWQKLNWRLCGIEPSNCHVTIDFEPGEFDWEVTRPKNQRPSPTTPSLRTAI